MYASDSRIFKMFALFLKKDLIYHSWNCLRLFWKNKWSEKSERGMSFCPVFSPFSLGKGGQQARQTDLILNLPVPPLTLYSYLDGITTINLSF